MKADYKYHYKRWCDFTLVNTQTTASYERCQETLDWDGNPWKISGYVQSLFHEHLLNAWAGHPGCAGILAHSSKFSLQPAGPLRVLRERSIGARVFQADCITGWHFPVGWSTSASKCAAVAALLHTFKQCLVSAGEGQTLNWLWFWPFAHCQHFCFRAGKVQYLALAGGGLARFWHTPLSRNIKISAFHTKQTLIILSRLLQCQPPWGPPLGLLLGNPAWEIR